MKRPQQDFFNALQPSFSRDRIAAYRLPGDDDIDVLARYLWNVRLSESLYPVSQALEVALRNSIHTAFAQGSGRQDWYDSTRGQFCLDQRQRIDRFPEISANGLDHGRTALRRIMI